MTSNDYKSIYNFTFVDRERERKIIEQFLDSDENDKSILIIRGKHGVGKTELINYYFKEKYSSKEYIIIEKLKDQKERYIDIFFETINKSRPKYLNDYAIEFLDKCLEYIKNIDLKVSPVNISSLVNLYDFDTISDMKMADNLILFFDSLYESGIRVIVLDNFSFCEEESKRLFKYIFNNYKKKNKMKFIVIDIEDDDITNLSIDYYINSFDHIKLENLKDQKYFQIIFDSINKDKPIDEQIINDVFDYCDGNFYRLIDLLRNCLFNSKANYILCADTLSEVLYNKRHIKNESNFSEIILNEPHACIIIMILFWFARPIKKELIRLIFTYILKNIGMSTYVKLFDIVFDKLKINNYIYDNSLNDNYFFKYDNDIIYLKKHIAETTFYKTYHMLIANEILKFINENDKILTEKYNLTKDALDNIKIYCMYLCKHVALQTESISLGNYYYEKKDYKQAAHIFDYIKDNIIANKNISKINLENILKSYYFSGQYMSAKEVMESFDLSSKKYYYFKSKIYNILLDKQAALESLSNINTKKSYKTLCKVSHMKIVILLDSENGFNEAKDIFNSFYCSNLKEAEPKNIYEALMLTNAFNFLEHLEAKKCMLTALNYFKTYKKQNENINFYIGMTYHNLGAIVVRKENTDDAEDYFKSAIEYLEASRNYELSYTYNDLAFIKILIGDYISALDYLSKALLYNNSEYALLAIRCNQLICYCMLNDTNIISAIVDDFENAINNKKYADDTINRKLIMNIIFYYMKRNDRERVKQILNKHSHIFKGTTSTIRYNKIIEKYNFTDFQRFEEKRDDNDISLSKDYEAWCITINHD